MARRKKTELLGVSAGDLYVGRTADGRYAAIHVIRVMKDGRGKGRDSALLALMDYFSDEAPSLDDPGVRKVLRVDSALRPNDAKVWWTGEQPHEGLECIGSFPPTEEELGIDPQGRSLPGWPIEYRRTVWRKEHDREAFEEELRREDARIAARQPKASPRAPLRDADFWALVAKSNLEAGDFEEAVRPLVEALAERGEPAIESFEETLAEKLYALDTRMHAEHAGDAGASDDAFLYARCHVVAQGREYYDAVLKDPAGFPANADFEPLLTAASAAYEEVTGHALEIDTRVSCETGSNAAGWSEKKRAKR